MTSCTAYRYVIFSVFMLLPVQVFTQSDCKLVGSVLDLIIRSTYDMINSASVCPHTVNHTESALLPVLLHRSSRVVPGAVHNRRAHAPRVAIRAVPPVVCNQKKNYSFVHRPKGFTLLIITENSPRNLLTRQEIIEL